MMKITFKSYIAWEDYARDYCEQNIERIFAMPEQDEINQMVDDILYQGFSNEYNIHLMDVEVPEDLRAEVEKGVRDYITEQVEENTVPAPVFETICDALNDSEHGEWVEAHLKEDKLYTKADLCNLLHDWLDVNDIY